jgi:restriction system protein
LEITRRSHFKITERGLQVLEKNPEKINVHFLKQFGEFRDFQVRVRVPSEIPGDVSPSQKVDLIESDSSSTPYELLRATITGIEAVLAKELLDRILQAPPSFFENLIVSLLLSMGYGGSREGAGRAIGKSGDGGIDGVIDQDPLGLDRVHLQAKRYQADIPVSEPEVRAFSG